MKIERISLKDIPVGINYEGYLWWSDQESPKVLLNEILTPLPVENKLPAIIEGYLFNSESQTSYSIRFLDDGYIVMKYEIDNTDIGDIVDFIPNRLNGVSKIKFLQYWKPEIDTLCEEFEVLKPKANVFVGFEIMGG